MAFKARTLVESQLYTWELSQLGDIRQIDDVLNRATWGLALLADEFDLVEGSDVIREYSWGPVLRKDGLIVELLIRFAINDDETVELLSIRQQSHKLS